MAVAVEEYGRAVGDSGRHPLQVGRDGPAAFTDYSVPHQGFAPPLAPFVDPLDSRVRQLWTSELFQSYVLGTPIERPFPVPKSPFADLMAGFMGGGTEDAAAADKKAKKAAKKGNATKVSAVARGSLLGADCVADCRAGCTRCVVDQARGQARCRRH